MSVRVHWAAAFSVASCLLFSAPLHARPLSEIKQNGSIALCANPNALPHATKKSEDMPGFQIEIGRALAQAMGVQLHVDWIIPRMRSVTVDCDILLDTIAMPEVLEGKVKLSHPYHQSGVALGLAPGSSDDVKGFGDLKPGQKIGVMINSLASVLLGKRGLDISPYAFEDEMISDLAEGKLYACASSPASIAYYSFIHPESKLRVVYAYDSEPELRWNLAVGMRRADDAMLNAVNEAVDKLLADGTLKGIYARYGIEHRKP
jgi:polar amino acid transport system substrate-binding protein